LNIEKVETTVYHMSIEVGIIYGDEAYEICIYETNCIAFMLGSLTSRVSEIA
jgi:hypothetical protein